MRRGWIQLLVCPVIAVAQSQTTPDPAYVRRLLGRIASAVRENIDRLPNYTCNMTVDRYQRAVKSKEPQTMDKVRLEVALVGDHELYAWPGSRHFEERPIRDLVPSGSISTGEFGLLTQSIFLGGVARFQYAGQESLNGHTVHHFLPVSRQRLDRALSLGWIDADQHTKFLREGAIGSHLENLERREGYKGFNQQAVSTIIAATDPRLH